MQPIIIAIIVVVVILFGSIGLLIFNSSRDDTEKEKEDTEEVTSADESSCNALGYYSNAKVASATTCSALGYTTADETSCKSLIDKAKEGTNPNPEAFYTENWCKSKYSTLKTSTSFCNALYSNIVNFASNAVTYYTSKTLFKVVPPGTNPTITYYGKTGSKPLSDNASLTAFRIDPNKYIAIAPAGLFDADAAGIYGQTLGSGTVYDLFKGSTTTTTTIKKLLNDILTGTSTFSNTDLWTKYGTQNDGTTWYSLNTSKLPAFIKSGFEKIATTGNDYNKYCV